LCQANILPGFAAAISFLIYNMMETKVHGKIGREEIKKEFQLERMILFSDAVFAVVITLISIEIKLPDSTESVTSQSLPTSSSFFLKSS
jgi:hypothetical protein